MNKYKICVYAISKNEEKFVDRWMDAVSEADMVVVADTGSTDKTVEKLRARGALVYEEKIVPWRFDEARNRALSHVPEDVDICVSNDLDEVFEPGWRKKLEDAWKEDTTRARYLFIYSFKEDGTPNHQFSMEKIHCRHGYRWVHPVHEVLKYDGAKPEKITWVDGMVLNHYPDHSKPRTQYLPLLELSAEENPDDDRGMFWLGREYMYYGQWDKSIKTLTHYLTMPTAKWEEERCAAMRFIARCYEQKGDKEQAKAWYFKAVAECPYVREPYLDLAMFGYRMKDWHLVMVMSLEALKITNSTGSYLVEPQAWGFAFHDLAALSMYYLGMRKQAYFHAKAAYDMAPHDERLKGNMLLMQKEAES